MNESHFETMRPHLFAIAYRMLGSVMDAEDILQEAWLRYQQVDPTTIESPQAYLSTIVTRLCLNQLTSARVQRESYIGPWLPEPFRTDEATYRAPAHQVMQHDSIAMAFLVLLERLSPAERAVFLLRDVFEYEYEEIAVMLDKSQAACRQLLRRAKQHLKAHRPRYESQPSSHDRLVHSFFQAIEAGDMEPLTHLLSEDVIIWTDGGGKVTAALEPIRGRVNVMRFITGSRRLAPGPFKAEIAAVNGRAAILLRTVPGEVFLVINVATDASHIRAFHIIGNHDKLHYL